MIELSPVITEWLSLIARWVHVTAAMAWIGSSFYFMQTDMKLVPGAHLPEGVQGEAWQVHGGNFWNMVKYTVAPPRMPSVFTWYIWESRVTWLSGFALLIVVYYMQADLFLIDKSVMDLSPAQAAIFSLISLVVLWFIYDGLCRSPLGRHEVALAVIVYVFLVVLAYAFSQVLSGRAAVNQVGAVVGTFMVANAFTVIHPNQRKNVAAMLKGTPADGELVRKARQRSIHNNYLTLPVILLMISNHYPLLYATRYNWLIVAIVLALGPIIRHFFNSRNAGKGSPWWTWMVTAAGMLAILYLSSLGARAEEAPAGSAATFGRAQEIVSTRCSMCHAREPVWPGLAAPGKNIILDDPEMVRRYAALIDMVAVRSNAMPPGNVTEMTTEERQVLRAWLDGRAAGRQESN
ncbi:urate hydroxylase PuuD [Bradyrhizobium sp. NP1]|uniref:urate hydroxylase PuuD n=1 Tax=Bradyrhizobium sp. NP1 TaxID=3049772 RepID=UPI0025A5D1D2|nr:urate hydroxylase PuuD [Bradyrhizobium sp. NP1]WJR76845.1 urate hydroxylase PuuD [Bradyrhizobium sp. NP1]